VALSRRSRYITAILALNSDSGREFGITCILRAWEDLRPGHSEPSNHDSVAGAPRAMVAVVIGNVDWNRTRVLIRGLGIDRALQFLRKLQREGSSHACDGDCDEHLLAATLTYVGQVSHAEWVIKLHALCR